MTVVDLIQALVPFGDYAEIRCVVTVDGRRVPYRTFVVRSDGGIGVELVIDASNDLQEKH